LLHPIPGCTPFDLEWLIEGLIEQAVFAVRLGKWFEAQWLSL